MNKLLNRLSPSIVFFTIFVGILQHNINCLADPIADHTKVEQFAAIPDSTLDSIRATQSILYGHTSHGGQLVTGMNMLFHELGSSYELPTMHEFSDDLGGYGSLEWVDVTHDMLAQPNDYTVVMWAWCGGVSSNSIEGIDAYLNAMDQLEGEYPEIAFIYMTGHLQEGGLAQNLLERNQQIRDFCIANNKILFDFADIETWDPAGNEYPEGTDACEWCHDWCASHECPDCNSCEHSHCLNCYRKGKALWWLLAQLEDWHLSSGQSSMGSLKAMFR